jgi:hypothetical protein
MLAALVPCADARASKADDLATHGGAICILPPAQPIPPLLPSVARL